MIIMNADQKWYQKNREYKLGYYKQYYEKNKNKWKKHYEENKEIIKNRVSEYKKNNPEKYLNYDRKSLEKQGIVFHMNSKEYHSALYNWANSIKKRDKLCQQCNSTSILNAHHIFPRFKYPEISLNLNNGITLCKDCHIFLHSF